MRIRSFVSSTAFLGTLLASSALVSDALAQKGTMMRPSTAWAVAKVDNAAGAYCTMARQFNRNTVLTFAQNEGSETSLALDFQRPAFQAGAQVSVILDPGAGQQRAYQTTPVSNKAFVVRLGRDDSFFDALERTGLLRVEVGKQSYHFNVSDIEKGQSNLDSCVANMVMPAAGDEGPLTPAAAPVVADAGASYRKEINGLRGQISKLRSENESLKVQMQTRTDSAAETSGSVAQLAAQIRQLEDENATLKSQVQLANVVTSVESTAGDSAEMAELKAENARLKAELQTAMPQEEVLAGLEVEIDALKAQNEKLEVALNSQSDDESRVAALQEQLDDMRAQNVELNTKILAARKAVSSEYEEKIAALKDENAALKSTMGKKGVDAELLEQLRQQIAQAENENRLLQETAAQAQKTLEDQFKQDNKLALEAARAEHANKITQLEEELAGLRAENVVKADELVALGEETSNLQALQEENETLKQRLAAMETQRGQAEVLVERIANLEVENEDLKKQLLDVQPAAELTDQGPSEEVLALIDENAALLKKVNDSEVQAEQLAALEGQISELKIENKEMQALREKYAALEKRLEEGSGRDEEISSLEEQIAALKAESEGAQALRDENAALQQKIEEGEARATQIAALEEQVSALKAENQEIQALANDDSVKQQLDTALNANEALSALIKDKDEQLLELEVLRGKLAAIEAQSPDSRAVETLQSQHDEMKTALADVVAVAERYKQENGEQKQQIAALETAQSDLEEQVRQAQEAQQVALKAKAMAEETQQVQQAAQETAAPVKVEPEASPEEAAPAVEVAAAPPPQRKPQFAARGSAPVEPEVVQDVAVKQEPVPMQETDERVIDDRYAALDALQEEMRNTDVEDQRRMQQLAREYMILKSAIERAEYETAAVEPSAEMVKEEEPYEDLSTLSEAQIQERAMKLAQKERALLLQAVEQDAEAAPQDDIVLSKSADPFEDLSVEGEQAQAGDQIDLQTLAKAEPVTPELARDAVIPVVEPEGLSVKALITQAEVSTLDKIKKVDGASDDFDVAYQWNGGSIYGSAEQKPLATPGQFDDLVQDYLERTQTRCPGEFAIVPDNTVDRGSVRADSYEVACVGENVSSGASLLFFNQGGTFTVVAHEAPTEELGQAMSYRNKLMRFITGS